MSLYTDLAGGLLLSSANSPVGAPIDIVLLAQGGVVVGLGNWWRLPADGRQGALQFLSGTLARQGKQGWKLTGRLDGVNLYLLPAETSAERGQVAEVSQARRMLAAQYLKVLEFVAATSDPLSRASLGEWVQVVQALPPLDPATLLEVPERPVGRVLLEESGVAVAALLLDTSGDYHVAGDADTWLDSIGSEWQNNPVDLPNFLAWVRTKTPYGPRTILRVDSLITHGQLVAIAPPFHHTTV